MPTTTQSANEPRKISARSSLFFVFCLPLVTGLGLCSGGSLDPRRSSVLSLVNPSTLSTHHSTVIPTGVETSPRHPERSKGSLFVLPPFSTVHKTNQGAAFAQNRSILP